MECLLRGDLDPDLEYVLRGAYFGYKVTDESGSSAYNKQNYGLITKGEVGQSCWGAFNER